jgi:DNA recombination protein RmuC
MNTVIIALLALLIIGVAVVIALLSRRPKEDQSALLMNQNLQGLQRSMDQRLSESNKIIVTVTEKLAKLDETNRQVVNFTDQLKNLQDILKNPKQRGILGEFYLESVLKNVLPPKTYQMQYKFKDGEIVDAVVFVKDRIIPVDAKFSLENYNRILASRDDGERAELEKAFKNDLKNRIDETAKYVRPTERTTEFAFMFIPSEAIYYDLLVNQIGAIKVNTQDLIQYAFQQKKVIIVSPTTFLAYLQTVLQGLRALQIEESAIEIRKAVEQLGKHLTSYHDYFSKVGNYLGSAVGAYNKASDEFRKIDKDVIKIAERGTGFEPQTLERPREE